MQVYYDISLNTFAYSRIVKLREELKQDMQRRAISYRKASENLEECF